MRGRHLTTAVTLLVLVGILAVAVMLGVRSFFAPLPSDQPSAGRSPDCSTTSVRTGQRIRARQVQVSVFNAGSRAGLATETMGALRKRGFKKGTIGNAPEGSRVSNTQVWTTERNDVAARLVARQFGRSTKMRVVDTDLGPGVDIVIGNGFTKLAKAKTAIVVTKPSRACVPRPAR